MGDISEMRGLIVLFTIIAVSISLIALIPAGFYPASVTEPNKPDIDVNRIIAWNASDTINITHGADHTFQANGYNFMLKSGVWGTNDIRLLTYAEWIIKWDFDYCKWYDSNGNDLSNLDGITGYWQMFAGELDALGVPAEVTAKNSRTQLKVVFTYNETLYSSYTEALYADNLQAIFNVDFDDRLTSMNALQLVGMVLTGSLPDIHPVLSVVFGFIGWGLVAAASYLAFIFVLRIVGAVFGGGGA